MYFIIDVLRLTIFMNNELKLIVSLFTSIKLKALYLTNYLLTLIIDDLSILDLRLITV